MIDDSPLTPEAENNLLILVVKGCSQRIAHIASRYPSSPQHAWCREASKVGTLLHSIAELKIDQRVPEPDRKTLTVVIKSSRDLLERLAKLPPASCPCFSAFLAEMRSRLEAANLSHMFKLYNAISKFPAASISWLHSADNTSFESVWRALVMGHRLLHAKSQDVIEAVENGAEFVELLSDTIRDTSLAFSDAQQHLARHGWQVAMDSEEK